jgi:adenosylmethionine-8-amino-7-oxononanoate aminotransferase
MPPLLADDAGFRPRRPDLICVDRGQGVYLYDAAGNRYLDAGSASDGEGCSIGYGVPEIAGAIAAQAGKAHLLPPTPFCSPAGIELADRLAAIAPKGLTNALFVSDGTAAVERALKLARQYQLRKGNTSRYRVIARWLSYHGDSIGALGLTGLAQERARYEPLLPNFPHIVPCYCYRCPFRKSYPGCDLACASDLEREVLQSGPETIAAFIAEPITSWAAVGQAPPPGYFRSIRSICDRYGLLLIADCVRTGFGRTGAAFASDSWGVTPDIIVFGRAVAGGLLPLGGLLISDKIRDVLAGHFSEPSWTPEVSALSAAVGVEVIQITQRDQLFGQAQVSGRYLLDGLRELGVRHPIIGEVRGQGLLAGVELVKERATRQAFPSDVELHRRVVAAARERGVLLSALPGDAAFGAGAQLRLAPPLIITEPELDLLLATLDGVLGDVEAELL